MNNKNLPNTKSAYLPDRRHVTIFFADISGFTALSEQLDPEEVRNILNACFDELVPIIEEKGGFIDKFIGDEIMALFGAPVAIGLEEVKAVEAALLLLEGIQEFNKRAGTRLGIHIGINTGLVVAGGIGSNQKQQYTVIGDAVNLAARLEQLASEGEVFVGPETYEAAKSHFLFESLDPVKLKGKSKAVKVYKPIKRKEGQTYAKGLKALNLIGRNNELRMAEEWLMGASNNQGLYIQGAPGIGLSSFVQKIGSMAEAKAYHVLVINSSYFDSQSFLPSIKELFRQLLKINSTALSVSVKQYPFLKKMRLSNSWSLDAFDVLNWFLGLPLSNLAHENLERINPETLNGLLRQVLTAILEEETRKKQVLVIMEEVEGFSQTTLETIGFFMKLPQIKAKWAFTNGLTSVPSGALAKFSLCKTIQLLPLKEKESVKLFLSLGGVSKLNPNDMQKVINSCQGVPGLLIGVNNYLLAQEKERINFRELERANLFSLNRLAQARVDGLENKHKRVLSFASVAGMEFESNLLSGLFQKELSESELFESLIALQQGGFIRIIGNRGRYQFVETVIKEAAYFGLLNKTKKQIHHRIADWYNQRMDTNEKLPFGAIAQHYQKAGANESALKFLDLAIEEAHKTFSNFQCIDFLQQAIELAGESFDAVGRKDKALKFKLANYYVKLSEMASLTLQPKLAESAYQSILLLFPTKEWVIKARALKHHAQALNAIRNVVDSLAVINTAIEYVEKERHASDATIKSLYVDCLIEKAKSLYFSAKRELIQSFMKEIKPQFVKVATPIQQQKFNDAVILLELLLHRYYNLPVSVRKLSYGNLESAKQYGGPMEFLWALNMHAFLLFWEGEYKESEASFLQSVKLAEELSSYENLITNLHYLSVIYRVTGNKRKFTLFLNKGINLSKQIASPYATLFLASQLLQSIYENKKEQSYEYAKDLALRTQKYPTAYPVKFFYAAPLLYYSILNDQFANAAEYIEIILGSNQKQWPKVIEETLRKMQKLISQNKYKEAKALFNELLKLNHALKLPLL